MSYSSFFSPFAKDTFLKPACLCHLHILTPPLAALHPVDSICFQTLHKSIAIIWSAQLLSNLHHH